MPSPKYQRYWFSVPNDLLVNTTVQGTEQLLKGSVKEAVGVFMVSIRLSVSEQDTHKEDRTTISKKVNRCKYMLGILKAFNVNC